MELFSYIVNILRIVFAIVIILGFWFLFYQICTMIGDFFKFAEHFLQFIGFIKRSVLKTIHKFQEKKF